MKYKDEKEVHWCGFGDFVKSTAGEVIMSGVFGLSLGLNCNRNYKRRVDYSS